VGSKHPLQLPLPRAEALFVCSCQCRGWQQSRRRACTFLPKRMSPMRSPHSPHTPEPVQPLAHQVAPPILLQHQGGGQLPRPGLISSPARRWWQRACPPFSVRGCGSVQRGGDKGRRQDDAPALARTWSVRTALPARLQRAPAATRRLRLPWWLILGGSWQPVLRYIGPIYL